MNPFFVTDFSISDSLKTVRKSVLIYETIIDRVTVYVIAEDKEHMEEITELVRDIPRDSYNLAVTYDTGIFDGSNDITKLPGCKRRNILDRIRESLGMVTGRKTA